LLAALLALYLARRTAEQAPPVPQME
jgi:hypothetical protein